MATVVKAVKKRLTQNIGSAAADVTLDTILFDDLGLSEAQVAELLSALADDLDLTSAEVPGPGLRTVADVVSCVEARLQH